MDDVGLGGALTNSSASLGLQDLPHGKVAGSVTGVHAVMPNRHARRRIEAVEKGSTDRLALGRDIARIRFAKLLDGRPVDFVETGFGSLQIPRAYTRIADAVESSLAEWPDALPPLDCYRRAGIAHAVLSVVTGRTWYINAGRFFADTGQEDCETAQIGWAPEKAREERRPSVEAHAWVVCPLDALPPTGVHKVHRDRAVMFDSSSRYLPENAKMLGGTWSRPVLSVAYGTHRDLWNAGYFYEADVASSDAAMKIVGNSTRMIEAVIRRALVALL